MKNNIRLNIAHNNAKRMEYFLNSVDETLFPQPFEWRSWKLSDRIEDGCRFMSKENNPVTITVLFCDSYNDGIEIAKANKLTTLPTAKWSLNGNLLYFVESADAEKVSEILSLFAGEE